MRKRPRGAPTYVESWPLRMNPRATSVAGTRFEAGRRVYNACLGEAVRRSLTVKADPGWEEARKLPKGKPGSPEAKARRDAFKALDERHGFSERELMSYASHLRVAWVRDHVLAQEAQVLGRRAFGAVRSWHLGLRGKPRFRPVSRPLRSLECKDLFGFVQPVMDGGQLVGVRWGKDLVLGVAQPRSEAEAHELARLSCLLASGELLSCRIVRTRIGSRWTYRVQFVVDGSSPLRHPVREGKVSLDMGPSWVDVVPQDAPAFTAKLADGVERNRRELRTVSRKLDRQHRAGSPSCFDERGRHKPGGCDWKERSKNAARTKDRLADAHRRLAAQRLCAHRHLANHILAIGTSVRLEDLDYRSWQKNFPHSVRDRAPGLFVRELCRKAGSAGASAYGFSPFTTALSQRCVCGKKANKPLSERTHRCPCGVSAPRDHFSAFLGLFVHPVVDEEGNTTDLLDVEEARLALLSRDDICGDPASGSTKLRGSRRRWRPHPRAVARRRARLNRSPQPTGDGAARANPAQPVPTALVLAP